MCDEHEVRQIGALLNLNIDAVAVHGRHASQFLNGLGKNRVTAALEPVPAGGRQIQYLDQVRELDCMPLSRTAAPQNGFHVEP